MDGLLGRNHDMHARFMRPAMPRLAKNLVGSVTNRIWTSQDHFLMRTTALVPVCAAFLPDKTGSRLCKSTHNITINPLDSGVWCSFEALESTSEIE